MPCLPRMSTRPLAALAIVLCCLAPTELPAQFAPPGDVPELYLLIRSRRYQEALAAAENYAKTGQFSPAIEAIQWILTQPNDVLIRDSSGDFHSARREAQRVLQSLPATAREQYQRIQGATASGEWGRVVAPHSLATCLKLVRTHFATEAGYLAAASLVSRWVDEGNPDLAAALALRVIEDPAHRRRVTAAFVRRAETACRLAGREKEANRLRDHALSLAADSSTVPPVDSAPDDDSAWCSRITDVVPLSRPLWEQPLESFHTYPQLEEDWKKWSAEKRDKDLPTAVAWQPVIVGRQLIFRDVQTIHGLDVNTGRTLWSYATQLGVEQLLNPSGADRAIARKLQWEYWESVFGNSLTGGLTTDGVRVYTVNDAESFSLASRRVAELRDFDDASARPAVSSLIALNVTADDESDRLAWSSTTGPGEAGKPLAGHAFLGPPELSGGMAFVMAERDRELVLAALEAASGKLLWRQPVALADRALLEDRPRSLRASIPTVARGTVLCPTNVGLLVAVDAVTGEFRWYHSCLDPSREARQLARAVLPPVHRRHSGFVPLIHAMDNRAVYLPTQSEFAYCLDITTGEELWKSSQPDAEYIGGLTADRAVLVGRTAIRALSLETGDVLWSTRLDNVPAGQGILVDDGYLLPLDSGKVIAVQLKDGARIGASFTTERRPSGHLVLGADVLLAVGGNGAAAYPQAGPMLRRLRSGVASRPATAEQTLDLADVYLAQGDLLQAIDALQTALAASVPQSRRSTAEHTLREAYFRLLADRPERSNEWFQQLKPLCRTPGDQARLLMAQSSWYLDQGQREKLTALGTALAANADEALHEAPRDPALMVSVPAWLAHLDARIPLKGEFETAATSGLSPQTAELAFPESAIARSARVQLAREDRASGRFHAAEIRWLRNLQQQDTVEAAMAARELAALYDAAGLSARAAEQLDLLATRFAKAEVAPGLSGAEVVRRWPEGSASRVAWERRQPVSWPVDRVSISLKPRMDVTLADPANKADALSWNDNAEGLYGEFQRRFNPVRADAPYDWLLKTWGSQSWLTIFDKTASRPLRTVSIPSGAEWPAKDIVQNIGLAQTFGLPGEIRCVSLLQGATDGFAWTASTSAWTGRTSVPKTGPATPFAALYQLRNELLVVDPAAGRVLWKRDDLEPGSGLNADSQTGLLLDDRVVFVLGADRQSYRIYDLATGSLIRQKRFERDPRPGSGMFATGTLVHYLVETGTLRSLRVWDLAADELVFEEPVRDRNLLHQIALEKDLVWLTPEGRLRVFDFETRRRVIDCELDSEELEGVVSLKALRQGSRYVVNLGKNSAVARTENIHEPVRDPLLPAVIMKDELLAVEFGRSTPLWRTVSPFRSFLQWGGVPAPMLVGASIVKARQDNQKRWLVIEALDPATGVRLGYSDQLPEMRLYHADYDGTSGRIRIIGDRGDIELRFDRASQALTEGL